MFKDFYDAWHFLDEHPMCQDENGDSRFLDECLDVEVAKVNPTTCEIDDNKALNTKVEVWLEMGAYNKEYREHDIDLDCGGNTYEEAIINMANNVLNQYGNTSNRIKPSSFDEEED